MNHNDREHYRIARKLEDLHNYSTLVAVAFIGFWCLLSIAFIVTILQLIW